MRVILVLAALVLTTTVGCGIALPAPSQADMVGCLGAQQRYDWLGRDVVLSVRANGCRSPTGVGLDEDAALRQLGSQAWRRAVVRVDKVDVTVGGTDLNGVGPRTLILDAAEATRLWGPAPAASVDAAQRRAEVDADLQVAGLWSYAWTLFLGVASVVTIALRRAGVVIFVWRRL